MQNPVECVSLDHPPLRATHISVVRRVLEDHDDFAPGHSVRGLERLALVKGNIHVPFHRIMVYHGLQKLLSQPLANMYTSPTSVSSKKKRRAGRYANELTACSGCPCAAASSALSETRRPAHNVANPQCCRIISSVGFGQSAVAAALGPGSDDGNTATTLATLTAPIFRYKLHLKLFTGDHVIKVHNLERPLLGW